jgi:hypothetical protein
MSPRLALAIIVPHGLTDVLHHRLAVVIATHAIATAARGKRERLLLLATTSLVHIANDFAGPPSVRVVLSLLMHRVWLTYPVLCLVYLACVHTPLHYKRVMPTHLFTGLLLLCTGAAWVLCHDADKSMALLCGDYWWIAPAAAHIVLDTLTKLRG